MNNLKLYYEKITTSQKRKEWNLNVSDSFISMFTDTPLKKITKENLVTWCVNPSPHDLRKEVKSADIHSYLLGKRGK